MRSHSSRRSCAAESFGTLVAASALASLVACGVGGGGGGFNGPDASAKPGRTGEGSDDNGGGDGRGNGASPDGTPNPDGAPEESGSGDTDAYNPCDATATCKPGLRCVRTRKDPKYGQCTKSCESPDDCPAPPGGNKVSCFRNRCISLCGVHGGTCNPGLECYVDESCFEPVTTVPTKEAGQRCTDRSECKNDAECVEGQSTRPYCAPPCNTDDDCSASAPGAKGTCAQAGTKKICIYRCGALGGAADAKCPGDMVCEVAICR
jgi:hypothetical protein